MKWKFWEKDKPLTDEPVENQGSAVTVSLDDVYVQGYNEGYAQGVHDTKIKLREVARRLTHGKEERY